MPTPKAVAAAPMQPVDDVVIATLSAIESLTSAIGAAQQLALIRSQQKLSNNRITSVVKELKELRKVLVFYTATC